MLPSIWSMLVSTVVFFVVAWHLRRWLAEQGLPKGLTRGLLVFLLAYLAAWGAGKLVDKVIGDDEPSQLEQQSSEALTLMLEQLQQLPQKKQQSQQASSKNYD